jgi:hypothetical protein
MKTVYCVSIVAALLLASAVFAQGNKAAEQPKEQPKAQPATPAAPAKATEQAPPVRRGPREMMAEQIAQVQAERKTAIDELQAIKTLAVEEKATKTAEALTKLIDKRNAEFEQRIQAMQQRMKMFEGAQVQPPAEPKKAAPKAPVAEPKAEKKAQ